MFTSAITKDDLYAVARATQEKPTMTSSILTEFHLFNDLAPEIRFKVWQFACAARVVTVRYDKENDRCISNTSPPAILSANQESREEALRYYELAFGTKSNSAHIYFNPDRDTLYLPRYRMMGYDDTLRDFRGYLSHPDVLEGVRRLALDHVDVEVKRPWESWNKCSLIRGFSRLEEMVLVLCDRGRSRAALIEDVTFEAPTEDPEALLRVWADFRQTFFNEQKVYEDVLKEVGKECVPYALPTVRIKSRSPCRKVIPSISGFDGMSSLRIS